MPGLDPVDASVLMALQYRFTLSEDPYRDAAEAVGVSVDELLGRARRLAGAGALKRVGFYLNYRSTGLSATLVAYRSGGRLRELAEYYKTDDLATHVYLRDHPYFDVWVVVKRPSREELEAHIEEVSRKLGVEYVILYSKRTYKLSVKYDVYTGLSRAGRYAWVNPSPPRPEDLGYPLSLARLLRILPLEPRPYRGIAQRIGMSEGEVVEAARAMLEKGVLGDPGAALDGHRIGFRENAMVVMEPAGSEEELCECVSRLPFTTHVVLRDPKPRHAWRHTCYFMVHAVSKPLVARAVDAARSICKPKSLLVIRSLADLKPGVVR
ncbi:Lrp/AsnC family transcriptional regulator [Stetteria hydrogenophila]